MQPETADAAYLWDMLEAAKEALQFLDGKELDAFLAERGLQLIMERELEIIVEAARRISEVSGKHTLKYRGAK